MVPNAWAVRPWHVELSIVNQPENVCVLGLILHSAARVIFQKCKSDLDSPSFKSSTGFLTALRIKSRLVTSRAPLWSPQLPFPSPLVLSYVLRSAVF